jgi:hypothetical protein
MLAVVAIASPVAAAETGKAKVSASASAAACTKAKKALKKAKRSVKTAKRSGSANQLKRAKKKLAHAKQAKQRACGGGAGAAWVDGRWQGTYAENATNLAFNVVGNRLYTGPFDSFFIYANCAGAGGSDPSAVGPVEASIAGNGDFSGSGTYNTGFTQIPWTISGHIAGKSITGGTFSVSYTNTFGDPCSGTTHFTAQWYGPYTF